jgi:hypothetical protein
MQLPAQAARQLPDPSTTLQVDSSSTDDSRLRGALPRPDSCTAANGAFIRSPRRRARAPKAGTSRPSALAVLRLTTSSYFTIVEIRSSRFPARVPEYRRCHQTFQSRSPLYACVLVGLLTSVQSVPTLPTITFGVKLFPVDCHSVNVPVLVLRHNRSLMPSPL